MRARYLVEVPVVPPVEGGDVDVDDVAILELAHVGDAVADDLWQCVAG